MTRFVALLKAVNVGGTGKLPMAKLTELCEAAGLLDVRTYIASGNALFTSVQSESRIKAALEAQLKTYAGKDVGVIVRTVSEIADVVARNPFPNEPGNKVSVLFTDAELPRTALDDAKGLQDEQIRLGKRELFVFYPNGIGASRLSIPSQKVGTARNMNTVAKLALLDPA